ncbi:MAG: pepsin/retropepsin-like aspartic protease family protein [Gemmatimonadaceae bacterium]
MIKHRVRSTVLPFFALATAVFSSAAHSQAATIVDRATVTLSVEANRPYIDITFTRADGSERKAHFLLDTGGGGFLFTEPLARDLGLTWGDVMQEEGSEMAIVKTLPAVRIGDFSIELNPQRIVVMIGKDNILPERAVGRGRAEGMFPAHLLSKYHVVFDYPAATFTIAKPGVLTPRGAVFPMPVGRPSGFPRTEITVDGKTYGMLIDTGASFTMVSDSVLKSWGDAHKDWERHTGAFGEAATLGGQTIETMFVPTATWATFQIAPLGVTSQRTGTFEKYMSQMMAGPIVGSLAGNVLKHYRLELDYANQKLYVSEK